MACKIELKDNKIFRVLDEAGNESLLFKEIAALPHVKTMEDALDIYKNVFTQRMSQGSSLVTEAGEKKYGKGMSDKIENIVSNMNHPVYKSIFAFWKSKGGNIRMYGGRGDSEGIASYNRKTKEIAINVNHSKFVEYYSTQDKVDKTVAHEVIHAIIDMSMDRTPGLRETFDAELQEAVNILVANQENANEHVQRMIGFITKGSPEEILTYALTDSEVASFLDSIVIEQTPTKPASTIWDRIKNLILSIIRLDGNKTLFDSVVNTMNNYVGDFRANSAFYKPSVEMSNIAREYVESTEMGYTEDFKVTSLDVENSKKIAQLYSEMKHDPQNPDVLAAYNAMIVETEAQFEFLVQRGYEVELYEGQGEPYASSKDLIDDLVNNKHIYVFSTKEGFGGTEINAEDNPLLASSRFTDIKGKELLVNDLFRAVHDMFGHAKIGNGFGAVGEENAWLSHSMMYSPLARRAMTVETRGQNSFVNFSGANLEALAKIREGNRLIKEGNPEGQALVKEGQESLAFAEQKTGLLPEWVSEPNYDLYNKVEAVSTANEPSLKFVSDAGNTFTTLREALADSSGGDIQVGVGTEFKTLFTINSNTNPQTFDGFINFYIKSGLLSDKKILEEGTTYFKAEGKAASTQVVNEFIATEDARLFLGTQNVRLHKDGRIELRDGKGKIEIDGRSVEIASLAQMSNQELAQQFEDADMIAVSNAVRETILDRTFGDNVVEPLQATLSENDLKVRLLSLLEKMGVKTMSISDYVTNYSRRNGVEPSANALADMANQIIAFKNGEIELSALTEETAHFIVEAWNQEDISDLLRNIDKTYEWAQFSNIYRELYRKEGVVESELDDLVRREILGKVLASSLINNFTTQSEATNQNILDYIRGLFDRFIDSVRSLFTSQYEADLQSFTDQVQDMLLNQDITNYLNLQNLNNKKFVMYQVAPTSGSTAIDSILRKSKGLLQILQQQEKDLLKAGKGLRSNVKKLRELEQRIDREQIKKSIAELLNTANRQAKYITQAAELANKNNTFLSNEEGIVYHSLREVMAPMLSEIKEYLVRENNPENRAIIEQIDVITGQVSDIVGKIRTQDNKILSDIVDRMMRRHNLQDVVIKTQEGEKSVRDMLTDATKAALSDTTAFYATFGQLSHAKDPLLNLAGTIIHDLTLDANVNFLRNAKAFQRRIKELGFSEKDLSQFFDNGFILDVRDWSAFEAKEATIAAELTKELSGTTLSVQELIDLKRDPKKFKGVTYPELTLEQNREYNKRYRERMSPYLETVFTEEYYKSEQKKYDENGISDATVRERKDLSTDRGVLFARVKDENGRLRFTNQDRIDLNALNLKRRRLKSLYSELGDIKNGLRVTPGTLDEKVQTDKIEINGKIVEINRESASEEAIIAFDLNKLDLLYQAEERTNPTSLSDEFLTELQRIEQEEGRQEALDFFRLNSFTTFSESYWNSIGQNVRFTEQLRDIAGMEYIADRIDDLQERRRQILRQYQSQLNASETLVDEMPQNVKEEILVLSEEIDRYRMEGSRALQDTRNEEDILVSENTPNQAYYDAISDLGLRTVDEKIDFIIKNVTASDRRKILELQNIMLSGRPIPATKQLIIERFNQGDTNSTLLAYAESKLAPYYKRFAPEGYNETQRRLDETDESVYQIANELNSNPDLQVTNNFSYYKAEDQAFRNKNYKTDFEGGYFQPKINEFKNSKFDEMFAPTIVEGEIVSVGRNQELYTLYTEMLDFQRNNLRAMGEYGSHNLWKAPQISKTGMNKFFDFMKKDNKRETALESIKDALFYRVDDQAYGAEIDGESVIKATGVRYIPKYYLRDLENKEDVSDDLFYSMTAFAQQSYLYQSRKNYFSDMMAIQEALLDRQYPDGKAAEATATVKMFRSHMDAYLFGVQESKQLRVTLPVIGQVDLTKNIRFLHKWVMNRNLGFNAIVPFTSWVTAEASTVMEKYVQEYLNPHSSALARNEFAKLATPAMKDTFELDSTAKLNVLGEYVGIYNIAERYENSIYSKTMRSLPKLGMMLNQAANFPIIPRVMLNVLYDYRVIDGNILNFNQFKDTRKAQGVAEKDLIAEWKTYEGKAFYNYMDVTTTVNYDYARLREDLNSELSDEELEAFVKEKERGVISRVREVVKFVDGQIPDYERSAAQRHFFLSFFTTHRGWLSIAYARRFKNRHINFQTGQEEQGSYRSFANFISRNFGNAYSKGFRNFLKDVKEDWNSATDIERNNMKRVFIELGFLQGIIAVGWLLGAMADDDENKDLYALQLTNYLYYRLMNETTSAQTGIGGEFYNLVQSPIVGADTVKSIFSVSEYFNTDEIKTGRYAGMEKWQKQLMATIPGYKSAIDIGNPKDAYDSYKHFNPGVETYNPVMWMLNSTEAEE